MDIKEARAGGCSVRIDNVLQALPERQKVLQSRLKGLFGACADAEEQLKKGNPYERKVKVLCDKLNRIAKRLKEEIEQ